MTRIYCSRKNLVALPDYYFCRSLRPVAYIVIGVRGIVCVVLSLWFCSPTTDCLVCIYGQGILSFLGVELHLLLSLFFLVSLGKQTFGEVIQRIC